MICCFELILPDLSLEIFAHYCCSRIRNEFGNLFGLNMRRMKFFGFLYFFFLNIIILV